MSRSVFWTLEIWVSLHGPTLIGTCRNAVRVAQTQVVISFALPQGKKVVVMGDRMEAGVTQS